MGESDLKLAQTTPNETQTTCTTNPYIKLEQKKKPPTLSCLY